MKNLIFMCVMTLAFVAHQPAGLAAEDVVRQATDVIEGNGVFNVLTDESPSRIRLLDTGLKEAGLTAGSVIRSSDEIRVFANNEQKNSSPMARIWLNEGAGGAYWFHTGGEGEASEFVIPKGAMVVVWTRASAQSVKWTNIFE